VLNIIVISGKKQAGKSSAAKCILKEYVNKKISKELNNKLYSTDVLDTGETVVKDYKGKILNLEYPKSSDVLNTLRQFKVKIYSFADELKLFCINVLGLDPLQCYGTDDQKKSKTHIHWDSIPDDVRNYFAEYNPKGGATRGYMSARQVMQIFGTNLCREMDGNCWARATYTKIKHENPELAIIADARFPNEVTMGTEIGAKAIRLLRNPYDDQHESETALDNFPLGEYSFVIDNSDLEMDETHKKVWGYVKAVIK